MDNTGDAENLKKSTLNLIQLFDMKKIFLLASLTIIAVFFTSSGITSKMMGNWIKVSDSGCNRCVISNTEYTCGKCGSGMSGSWKWDQKQEYMVYTFKCKNSKKTGCTHQCIYKIKP